MNTTSDLTNDAIARQIADGNIAYDRIVFFEKDLDGQITALKTNMSEVNRLKTDILQIINDEIGLSPLIGICSNRFRYNRESVRCSGCPSPL